MAVLLAFLIGIQVLSSLADDPSPHPAQPQPALPLLSPSCNSTEVKFAAEVALNKINADRREGYMFTLQRIFDVHELPQQPRGSLFYIILDVLETECHVLSRRLWKDCAIRSAHETVYGQCKATLQVSRNLESGFLLNYDCVLRPISSVAVVRLCPDCPTQGDPTEARYQEAAAELLAKFNAENNHRHHFALISITRASSQWVVGPSAFVEFTIQETSCPKTKDVPDVSQCPLLPPETADTGLCKGSVVQSRIENQKFLHVNCELFHPKANDTSEQKPQSGADSEEEHHKDDHDHHRRRKGHRPHRPHHPHTHHRGSHHHHPHHHKHHDNHSDEHPKPQHLPVTAQAFPSLERRTVGRVIILPQANTHVSLHSLPEIGAEQLDGSPVPPQEERPNSNPSLPDIHGAPEGDTPVGRLSLAKPVRPIPPFPTGFSESDSCPGESRINILGLELPKRPVVKPPPQTSQTE